MSFWKVPQPLPARGPFRSLKRDLYSSLALERDVTLSQIEEGISTEKLVAFTGLVWGLVCGGRFLDYLMWGGPSTLWVVLKKGAVQPRAGTHIRGIPPRSLPRFLLQIPTLASFRDGVLTCKPFPSRS